MRKNILAVFLILSATVATAQSWSDVRRLADKTKGALKNRTMPAGAAADSATQRGADGQLMLWAERMRNGSENPLHSEVAINGQTVDIFTSDTWEPVGQYVKPGWN